MKRVLMVLGALAWAALVFTVTFWLTFPEQAFIDRIRAEAPGVLGRNYAVDLESVSPWWVGLSAGDVKVFHTPGRRSSAEGTGPTLVGLARDARVRVGLMSLLAREPYVSGSVTLTEGTVYFDVGTAMSEKGELGVQSLAVDASSFPLADLMVFLPEGTELDAIGSLDVTIDIEGGEEGMESADGDLRIRGSDITLSNVVVPGVGPLGFDVPISEVDLSFDVDEGTAKVESGRIVSELLTVEISGELKLRDPLDRTSVDLELVVSELGEQFRAFEMMMSSAKHGDGKYHYQCRGIASRLSSCPVPKRERTSRVSKSLPDRGASTYRPPSRESTAEDPFQKTEDDEERARRREEIRERLRQRREEREADLTGVRDRAEDEPLDDEEYLDDEEFEDEEFEDEEFLDEEGFEDEFIE